MSHALVIGGTKGLGKEVVKNFLNRDFGVSILSRNPPTDESLQDCHHISADLEELSGVSDWVEAILSFGGPLNYVVFCQRYRGEGDIWQGEMQVTLTATKVLMEALSNHFSLENNADRAIVVVSSVYAEYVGGSQPLGYHVAKAGLNQIVRYAAWDMGRKGIRVNGVMPLTYLKPESKDFYLSQESLMRLYEQFVPLKRMGEVEDSVSLIEFLCSPKASFINGQCIFVDGGVSVVWPEELARKISGI